MYLGHRFFIRCNGTSRLCIEECTQKNLMYIITLQFNYVKNTEVHLSKVWNWLRLYIYLYYDCICNIWQYVSRWTFMGRGRQWDGRPALSHVSNGRACGSRLYGNRTSLLRRLRTSHVRLQPLRTHGFRENSQVSFIINLFFTCLMSTGYSANVIWQCWEIYKCYYNK